jgi:hypothetical protein
MDDAERVCFGDRFASLKEIVERFFDRQLPAHVELGRQILSVQVLHDHVRCALFQRAYVDHAGDVLTSNPHRCACLSEKPRNRLLERA